MGFDRRAVLALTGPMLAGLAGCLGHLDDPADENDDGDGDEGRNGFDGYEVPDFPEPTFVTDPAVDEAILTDQLRANVAFSFALLEALREDDPHENLFFSPYSVSVALAMTYAGARGETADEMADAVRFAVDDSNLHPVLGALEDEFARRNEDGRVVEENEKFNGGDDESHGNEGESGGSENESGGNDDEPGGNDDDSNDETGPEFQFETANATWIDGTYSLEESYLETLETHYGSEDRQVDFRGDPVAAREEINEWVAAETNDRIEDLLPEGSIDSLTRLVLTNAVYFLAAWEHPFDEDATESGTFTDRDGTDHDVEMMQGTVRAPYAEIADHQFVELPYANGETGMVIVLPADGEFEAFEGSFSVDRLATLLEAASTTTVDLSIPKFGIESKFSLVNAMQTLGMERAFTEAADFTGMAEDDELHIGEIIHQSFIEVDEAGTEAAAATAVEVGVTAAPESVEMAVDRPFLFYVRDHPTETPVFVGRVVDGSSL